MRESAGCDAKGIWERRAPGQRGNFQPLLAVEALSGDAAEGLLSKTQVGLQNALAHEG